ncbi:MAG: hypothetical protein ACRCVN_02910 [Spirochaetia bacterium]
MLFIFFSSCSDPIFWVTSREQPISKNNLPKETQVSGVTVFDTKYYAAVGTSLWQRPVAGGEWTQVKVPASPVLGVAASGGNLIVGTGRGVYQSPNGRVFSLMAGSNKSTSVYTVAGTMYFMTNGPSLGQYDVYRGTLGGTPTHRINGIFTGAGPLGVSSTNAIFDNATGIARTRFSWLSGYNNNYLYADGKVGQHSGTAWTRSVGTGQPSNRGSAIFEMAGTGPVKALYSVYQLGYFELYEDGANLKVRKPTATVTNPDAYEVSDLAFATITGFYENGPDLFAFTSKKGLWRNTAGVWSQE